MLKINREHLSSIKINLREEFVKNPYGYKLFDDWCRSKLRRTGDSVLDDKLMLMLGLYILFFEDNNLNLLVASHYYFVKVIDPRQLPKVVIDNILEDPKHMIFREYSYKECIPVVNVYKLCILDALDSLRELNDIL